MHRPIILIPGICEHYFFLEPMKMFLISKNHECSIINYNVSSSFDNIIEQVQNKIYKKYKTLDVNIIGHSFGGYIIPFLDKSNKGVLITTPINGSGIIPFYINIFGYETTSKIFGSNYMKNNIKIPPIKFPYITISATMLNSDTDGIIKQNNTIIEQQKSINISNSNHYAILWDYRCLTKIQQFIDD